MIIQAVNGVVNVDLNKLFEDKKKSQLGTEEGVINNEPEVEEVPDDIINNLKDDDIVDWDDVEDGNDFDYQDNGSNDSSEENDNEDDDELDENANYDENDNEPDTDELDNDNNNNQSEEEQEPDTDELDEEVSKDPQGDKTNDSDKDDESENEETKTEPTTEGDEQESDTGESKETESTDVDKTESKDDNDETEIGRDGTNEEETTEEVEEPTPDELDDKALDKLQKQLDEQEKFNDGEIVQTKIAVDKYNSIEAIEDAGVDIETVGVGNGSTGIGTIVIKKTTDALMDANPFHCFAGTESVKAKCNSEHVEAGIRLGTMLGHKLQIRNEERNTQFTRLRTGKIDKRLVNSLGYGAEQVFSQIQTDRYNPVLLRISIDASGSMSGPKWDRTMLSVTAICKAASMVSNLNVVVDIRTVTNSVGSDKPLVIIAYDSRVDKFEKVRRVFPRLIARDRTPEGLCFEAILKTMVADKTKDQYFINFSDGAPCFYGRGFRYEGQFAYEHTRKQIQIMRDRGIKVLSFFIETYSDGRISAGFERMYGADARVIDVTQLVPLAKTINNLFI